MTNKFTLDQLRVDLDRQFAPLVIEVGDEQYTLRNLIRCNEKERDSVRDALKVVETAQSQTADEDESAADDMDTLKKMAAALESVIATVTADGRGRKLVTALGGDVALAMKVVEVWTEATRPGEAESSPA